MTISNQENFESHSEALQLPLFAAGMLDQSEHKQMEQHLKECPSCQKELEEEIKLRPSIHQAFGTFPNPSPRVLQQTKEKIALRASQEALKEKDEIEASPGWLASLEEWIRKLFLPRWVPSLAMLIILVQGSFLQYLLTSPPSSRPPGMEGPIFERELPLPTGESDHIHKIQILFSPNLSLKDVQTLLQNVHGTIIQGPSPDGDFVIALSYRNQEQLDEYLQTLRTAKAIQELKPLHP